MPGTLRYIALLLAFIGSTMGYVYSGSELQTVTVTGKHVVEGRGYKGRSSKRLVVETDNGDFAILKFPLIGYSVGADTVFDQLAPGQSIKIRVGHWPPDIISKHATPHIMSIF
ncbi:MAG: hypothetical protein ACRBCJ_09550 [Hyphomicrobiaceae bacterium]